MSNQLLDQFGHKQPATDIYLAALVLGTGSAQALATQSGLKRSTIYPYIEALVKDGFLQQVPIGKRTFYKATKPETLEERAKGNLTAIQSALPQLEELDRGLMGKPGVTVLEGKKGVSQIYAELEKANNIRFWSSLDSVSKFYDENFQSIAESVSTNEITTKEILANTEEAKKASKRFAKIAGRTYQAKISTIDGITNDSVIYDNTLALFRLFEYNFFVVRIEDKTIVDSIKALFDMAWESAEPF